MKEKTEFPLIRPTLSGEFATYRKALIEQELKEI